MKRYKKVWKDVRGLSEERKDGKIWTWKEWSKGIRKDQLIKERMYRHKKDSNDKKKDVNKKAL